MNYDSKILELLVDSGLANRDIVARLVPDIDKRPKRAARDIRLEIDRSLQRMRKASLIIYCDRRWHLAQRLPCTHCGGSAIEPPENRRRKKVAP